MAEASADAAESGENGSVLACPECDSARVERQSTPATRASRDDAAAYRCKACSWSGDNPTRRPRKKAPSRRRDGHVGALLEADPEDVP